MPFEQFTIRLEATQADAMRNAARDRGITLTEAIRLAIARFAAVPAKIDGILAKYAAASQTNVEELIADLLTEYAQQISNDT